MGFEVRKFLFGMFLFGYSVLGFFLGIWSLVFGNWNFGFWVPEFGVLGMEFVDQSLGL